MALGGTGGKQSCKTSHIGRAAAGFIESTGKVGRVRGIGHRVAQIVAQQHLSHALFPALPDTQRVDGEVLYVQGSGLATRISYRYRTLRLIGCSVKRIFLVGNALWTSDVVLISPA